MESSKCKYQGWLNRVNVVKIFLSIAFICMIFIPLLRMFLLITPEHIAQTVHSSNFLPSVFNSIVATLLGTLITLVIAFVLAFCIERVDLKGKKIFSVLFIVPMLIPSISHGMGLVILFGNNGIITQFLNLNVGIYGLKGIVAGSVLYAFPMAYLMIADVMKYQDYSPYEAANVLGIPAFQQFKEITLPYLRKPLVTTIFSVFSVIVTDYGVPLMVGGKYATLPVVMYQEVIGQLNFGKGAILGSVLLIPAVIAFILDVLNKDKGNLSTVVKPFKLINQKFVKGTAYAFCSLISILAILPIGSFIVLAFSRNYPIDMSFTFQNVLKTVQLHAGKYLMNSCIIAVVVSVLGVCIAFISAYMCARMKSRVGRFLHLSTMISMAVPGIVLGLSYILTFKNSFLFGTIFLLIMVNIVHFIASPYLMIYNSLSKLNGNLENVGSTLGIRRLRMILDVFVPMCKNSLLEMFSYFFVNSMITISAVSFLATTNNKPLALMINQFESQMLVECAAVVSLVILVINLLLKAVIMKFNKKS